MATIQDIADNAGVSIGTVSRVLNAKPDVSPQTRARILKVMETLNYRPSGLARGLALQRRRVIGFLAADIMNPNFPELARSVVDRARQHGYSVMFFDTRQNLDMEREAAHILENEHVAGVVAPILAEALDELARLHEQGVPVVRIYRDTFPLNTPLVALDNVRAGEIATNHLLDLGHRKIAFVGRDCMSLSDTERLEGYRCALAARGVPLEPAYVVSGAPTREGGALAMTALLELAEPPTAVFASKDVLAIGTYDAVIESGRSIPEDMSVIGHDDIEAGSLVRPRLTTMTTHRDRLGAAAVEMLVAQIDRNQDDNRSNDDEPVAERVFTAELVLRGSTMKHL